MVTGFEWFFSPEMLLSLLLVLSLSLFLVVSYVYLFVRLLFIFSDDPTCVCAGHCMFSIFQSTVYNSSRAFYIYQKK
jgi:hypothetical protein